MEHKEFFIEELKAEDDGTRTISGFGSVFNNTDLGGDIVLPGAFTRSLKSRNPSMLWQHDSGQIPGVWTKAEEQAKGLYLEGTFADTPLGNEAYTLAKMKALTGLSIGFSTKKYEIDQSKGTRKLLDLDLYEVSLVTFPMNEKATITRVKSMPGTLREFEEFLREAGYNRDDATTIALRGYKALNPEREAGADEQQAVAEILGDFVSKFKQ